MDGDMQGGKTSREGGALDGCSIYEGAPVIIKSTRIFILT
jgi:hypothetical protein